MKRTLDYKTCLLLKKAGFPQGTSIRVISEGLSCNADDEGKLVASGDYIDCPNTDELLARMHLVFVETYQYGAAIRYRAYEVGKKGDAIATSLVQALALFYPMATK